MSQRAKHSADTGKVSLNVSIHYALGDEPDKRHGLAQDDGKN